MRREDGIREKGQMRDIDMKRHFAQKPMQIEKVPTAQPKQPYTKTKKKATIAAIPIDKDKGKPKLEKMMLKKIPSAIWPQIKSNRKNLKDLRLWNSLLTCFEDQDDDRVRQFLKNSNFGARKTFLIDEDQIEFTPESIC